VCLNVGKIWGLKVPGASNYATIETGEDNRMWKWGILVGENRKKGRGPWAKVPGIMGQHMP